MSVVGNNIDPRAHLLTQLPLKGPREVIQASIATLSEPDSVSFEAKVTRFDKGANGKVHYVLEVKSSERNYVLFRTYDDFYNFQMKLLEMFEVKGMERRIPYLPGPKLFMTEAAHKKRRQELDDYCQDLLHLERRISQSQLVIDFFKERTDDLLRSGGIVFEKPGMKSAAPWSRSNEALAQGKSTDTLGKDSSGVPRVVCKVTYKGEKMCIHILKDAISLQGIKGAVKKKFNILFDNFDLLCVDGDSKILLRGDGDIPSDADTLSLSVKDR
ncbi:bud emergence protein 1 [Blyttiomyces sp. JEL0837]|nr:bud emergence protein 1 [Blyttiomyces sp. JEL0837]